MSQFLICKSNEKLTKYGKKIDDVMLNKDLYMKVIKKYMYNVNANNIWVVEKIHDILNVFEYGINIVEEISRKSELMIFWYGSDFEDLDIIDSRQMLMKYLEDNIDSPCLEIDLYVDLSNEFSK
ncbi:MAG: hypothetical protein ACI4GW_14025 [Lachnospiraceae bacterium]